MSSTARLIIRVHYSHSLYHRCSFSRRSFSTLLSTHHFSTSSTFGLVTVQCTCFPLIDFSNWVTVILFELPLLHSPQSNSGVTPPGRPGTSPSARPPALPSYDLSSSDCIISLSASLKPQSLPWPGLPSSHPLRSLASCAGSSFGFAALFVFWAVPFTPPPLRRPRRRQRLYSTLSSLRSLGSIPSHPIRRLPSQATRQPTNPFFGLLKSILVFPSIPPTPPPPHPLHRHRHLDRHGRKSRSSPLVHIGGRACPSASGFLCTLQHTLALWPSGSVVAVVVVAAVSHPSSFVVFHLFNRPCLPVHLSFA